LNPSQLITWSTDFSLQTRFVIDKNKLLGIFL